MTVKDKLLALKIGESTTINNIEIVRIEATKWQIGQLKMDLEAAITFIRN